MKTKNELRGLSFDELNAEIITLRKNQFTLRMMQSNGSLDKPHKITLVRKAIARVKTIITQKVGADHD